MSSAEGATAGTAALFNVHAWLGSHSAQEPSRVVDSGLIPGTIQTILYSPNNERLVVLPVLYEDKRESESLT